MKLFLLNALISPFESKGEGFVVFMYKKLSHEEFFNTLRQAKSQGYDVVSALGHESTTRFLQDLAPVDLKELFAFSRDPIFFEEGDLGLVFRLTSRGPEMAELGIEDLRERYDAGGVEFLLSSRVHSPELFFDPSIYFHSESTSV